MEMKIRNESELTDVSSWLKAVQVAFKSGDYNEVMNGINKLLGDPNCDQLLLPNEKEALIWGVKGAAALRDGRCQEAIDHFNQVLAIDLKNPMLSVLKNVLAWHSKASAFATMGRYEEAIQCFDQLLHIDPENFSALQNREKALSKKAEVTKEKLFEHSVHPAVIFKQLNDNTIQTLQFSKLREIGPHISLIQGNDLRGYSENQFEALKFLETFLSPPRFHNFSALVLISSISCIAAVSNEQVVIGNVTSGTLSLWDLTRKTFLQTFQGHTDSVNSVAVTSKGQIVSGSRDSTVRLWDSATGACLQTFQGHSSSVEYVMVTPDDQIVSGSGDKTIRLWDPGSGDCLQIFRGHNAPISCMGMFLPGQIITGSYDGTLKVWDLMQGTCLQTLQVDRDVSCLAVLQNKQVLVGHFSEYKKSNLKIWDLAKRVCIRTLETRGRISDLSVLSNGYILVRADRGLELWDSVNWICLNDSYVRERYRHDNRIKCTSFAILPNRQVITTTRLGYIDLWDPSPIKLLSQREQSELLWVVLKNKSITTLDLSGVRLTSVKLPKVHVDSVPLPSMLEMLHRIVSSHPTLTTLIFDASNMTWTQVKELLIEIFQNRKIIHVWMDGTIAIMKDGNIIGASFSDEFKKYLLEDLKTRCLACAEKGDYKDAVVWLEMILAIDPKSDVSWSILDNISTPFKVCTDHYYANTSFTNFSKRTARWELTMAAEDTNKTHLQQLCNCLEQLFTLKFHETSALAEENKFGERIISTNPNTPEEKLLDDLLAGWELINKTGAEQKALIENLVGQYKTHHTGGYWFEVGKKEADRILRLLEESIDVLSSMELLSLIDSIELAIVSDAKSSEGALWQGKPRMYQGLGICPFLQLGLNDLRNRVNNSSLHIPSQTNEPLPPAPSLPVETPPTRRFIRHPVESNGDCGYTAFGITRKDAHQLLKDYQDQNIIQKLLKPVLEEVLFNKAFIKYAKRKKALTQGILEAFANYKMHAEVGGDMPQKVIDHLKSYAGDRRLMETYIAYDILDMQIDNGWAHPCILQSLSHIQEIHLCLFQLDDQKNLIPHKQYPEYHPQNAKESKDLLFINRNHFELLEFEDQQNEVPRKTGISIQVVKEPIPLLLSDPHKASNIFYFHLSGRLSSFQTNAEVASMGYYLGEETGRWENIKAFSKAAVKLILNLTGPFGAILQITGALASAGSGIMEAAKPMFKLAKQSLGAVGAASEMADIVHPPTDKTFVKQLEERIRLLLGESKLTKEDQLKQFATVFAGTIGTKALERFIQGLLWRYHEQLALLSEEGGMQLAEVVGTHLTHLFQLDFIDWKSHDIRYELEGQGQEQQSGVLKVMWYWVDRMNFLKKEGQNTRVELRTKKESVEPTVLIHHAGYQCLNEGSEILYLDMKQWDSEKKAFFETQGQQWGYRRAGTDEAILEPFAKELECYREKNCINPTGKFTLQTFQRYRNHVPPIMEIKPVPFTWKSDSEEIVLLKGEVGKLCKENVILRKDVNDARSDAANSEKKAATATKIALDATNKADAIFRALPPAIQTQVRENLNAMGEEKGTEKDKSKKIESRMTNETDLIDPPTSYTPVILDMPTAPNAPTINIAAQYQPLFHAPDVVRGNSIENRAVVTIEEPPVSSTEKKEDKTNLTLN